MITIHHLNQSRSFRVVWLMEELQLPYDLVCHQRQADMRAPDGLRLVYALGHAPAIADDKTVMFESGAILEYIIHRYGQGRFSVACHHLDYAPYLQWLHAAEGTAMPALVPLALEGLGRGAATDAQKSANTAVLRLADDALAQRAYFGCEDFTAADIMMQTYLHLARRFAAPAMAPFGRLVDFLARVQARPAYQRSVELTEAI